MHITEGPLMGSLFSILRLRRIYILYIFAALQGFYQLKDIFSELLLQLPKL